MNMDLKIIRNRSELGAGTRGASLGPDALLMALWSLLPSVIKERTRIYDISSPVEKLLKKDVFQYAHRIEDIYAYQEEVFVTVKGLVSKEKGKCLVFSGDHSTSAATIAAMKSVCSDEELGIIWIDAHADIHSPYTTPSGNLHGMPLAMLLNEDNLDKRKNPCTPEEMYYWGKLKTLGAIAPKITYRNLVYVGLRDFEEEEAFLIHTHKVKVISADEFNQQKVETILSAITQYLQHCSVWVVSFDVDSLDPKEVSYGTGTPVENGLSYEKAKTFLKNLFLLPQVQMIEIVEINPLLDKENTMARKAAEIIREWL